MFEFEFEVDYVEHLNSLGQLIHEPIQPARESHAGEQVYLYQWQQLLAERHAGWPLNGKLAVILFDHHRPLTQRHASVAASFITWLGTNAGMNFRQHAEHLHTNNKLSAADAFTSAWAIENVRWRWHAGRNIDLILAPLDHFGEDLLTHGWRLQRQPDITGEDLEVLDVLVRWLADEEARTFIAECDRLIKIRDRVRDPIDTIKIIAGVASA